MGLQLPFHRVSPCPAIGGGKDHLGAEAKVEHSKFHLHTEAELVGVNNAMGCHLDLQTRLFIQGQGYTVTADNVLYQDNQSAMMLEKNGKMSSSKRTKHIEICFFFACHRQSQEETLEGRILSYRRHGWRFLH